MRPSRLLIVLGLGLLLVGIVIVLRWQGIPVPFSFVPSPSPLPAQSPAPPPVTNADCLSDDEYAEYIRDERYYNVPKAPLTILVKQKDKGEVKFNFIIPDAPIAFGFNLDQVELHKCGVYAMRDFGFYQRKDKFSLELWRYNYQGNGGRILTLSDDPLTKDDFTNDFRVDPIETYVALIRGYGGASVFELVFKRLDTLEDVFVLPYSDVLPLAQRFPIFQFFGGDFQGLGNWTKDGRYYWQDLAAAANIGAFLRIERDTWKVEPLEIPHRVLGGDAVNIEKGYVTYSTGIGWVGIDVIRKQVEEQWRKEGKIIELHLYNFFTKKDILLATSSNPSYWGVPRWISDTELEYLAPEEVDPQRGKVIYRIQ